MRSKTGINLTRQTITRFWKQNIYIQKPYNTGISFLQVFKICYIIEIFLVVFRALKLKSRNLNIIRDLKNKLHRVYEISSYKIINFRFNNKNKKLFLFCNIGMRSLMFPMLPIIFNYKQIIELLKKKLKQFKYNFLLLNYRRYIYFFTVKVKKYKKQIKKFVFLNLEIKLQALQNIYIVKKKNKYTQSNFLLKEKEHAEWNKWFFDTLQLQRILFRPFCKRIKWSLKRIKYKKKDYKKHKKNNNKIFFLHKLMWKKEYNYQILNKKMEIYKMKNFFKFYIYFFFRFSFYRNNSLKKLKFDFINKGKCCAFKNLIKEKVLHKERKNFYFLNFGLKNNLLQFNVRKTANFLIIANFWYVQFFNRFFENQFFYFLQKINFLLKIDIIFQQEFSIPSANYFLKIFNKRFLLATAFLKFNKKFYNNFINIMPIVQNFQAINILTKQFAIELSRTKKHWRVFRGLELLLMQSFVQFKKEPLENSSMFSGFYIIINGRPEKSSRTQKISFKFGQIKPSVFQKFNIFENTSSSSSSVGSFGISIIAAT